MTSPTEVDLALILFALRSTYLYLAMWMENKPTAKMITYLYRQGVASFILTLNPLHSVNIHREQFDLIHITPA